MYYHGEVHLTSCTFLQYYRLYLGYHLTCLLLINLPGNDILTIPVFYPLSKNILFAIWFSVFPTTSFTNLRDYRLHLRQIKKKYTRYKMGGTMSKTRLTNVLGTGFKFVFCSYSYVWYFQSGIIFYHFRGWGVGLWLWCLTTLSTVFQLYRECQF